MNRLNGHLEQALRTNPALADPASAERFRDAFMQTNAAAYAREGTAAQGLADSIRAAEPLLRTPPNDSMGMMDAPALRDRMTVARRLSALAQSSGSAQAAELAGQMRTGQNPPLPEQVANEIAERAAATGIREFMRTGDPARIGAAGFAALGAGGAAYAAIVGGEPITIGVAAVAAGCR